MSSDSHVELSGPAIAVLERHGLIDVLRPHVIASDPLTIAPSEFEHVLKQHCVADLNVAVYDRVEVVERTVSGRSLRGVLTDGTSRWDLVADTWIDADALPVSLPAAIIDGAAAALDTITKLRGLDKPAP